MQELNKRYFLQIGDNNWLKGFKPKLAIKELSVISSRFKKVCCRKGSKTIRLSSCKYLKKLIAQVNIKKSIRQFSKNLKASTNLVTASIKAQEIIPTISSYKNQFHNNIHKTRSCHLLATKKREVSYRLKIIRLKEVNKI